MQRFEILNTIYCWCILKDDLNTWFWQWRSNYNGWWVQYSSHRIKKTLSVYNTFCGHMGVDFLIKQLDALGHNLETQT